MEGDKVQMRFSPPIDWDGSATTITSVSADGRISTNAPILWTATTTTSQTFDTDVVVSDQMPEQKIYDFILGLIKMFNLVIEPTSRTKFIV